MTNYLRMMILDLERLDDWLEHDRWRSADFYWVWCWYTGFRSGRMPRLRRKQQNARRRVIIEMRDRLSSHPSSGFLLSWLRVHLHLRERERTCSLHFAIRLIILIMTLRLAFCCFRRSLSILPGSASPVIGCKVFFGFQCQFQKSDVDLTSGTVFNKERFMYQAVIFAGWKC